MTLYELTGQYLELLEMAEDPDVDPEVFKDTLEGLDGEVEEKAEGYAKIIKALEAEAAGYKAEADRLTARRKTAENRVESLKWALQSAMTATGKTKFKTSLFSFAVQKNPVSMRILDETKVPEEYKIPQPDKIDNAKIKDWLKDGGECDWAELYQTESLRIR